MSFTIPSRPTALALLFGALSVASCGYGDDIDTSTANGGRVDLLITDSVTDQLLSFDITLRDLRLVNTFGGVGLDLLDRDVSVDLIGSSAAPTWLMGRHFPIGTYRGMQVTLVPGSTSARDRSGADVAITELVTTFEVPFPSPVSFAPGIYQRLTLDIDLLESLSGTLAAPPLAFDPMASFEVAGAAASSSAVAPQAGVVKSFDALAETLVLDAVSADDQALVIDDTTVEIDVTTLLVDDDGTVFADVPSFFAALTAGATRLEVHGVLSGGRLVAERVEIEHDGVNAPYFVVTLDGYVFNLDTLNTAFDLALIDVVKGASLAQPVIGAASSVAVGYDPATLFLRDVNTVVTDADLLDGQRVRVKFAVFVTAPFAAVEVEIQRQPEFEGVITDTSGLPNTITITLNDAEPALGFGWVDTSSTPVTVDLTTSTLVLDSFGEPLLATSQLQTGLALEVLGALAGPSNAPTITALESRVHAGKLRADVTAIYPGLSSIDVAITSVWDSFGDTVVGGTPIVDFDATCVFSGAALTETEFYSLFTGLGFGQRLEADVFGIGSGLPDVILAYEVRTRVLSPGN